MSLYLRAASLGCGSDFSGIWWESHKMFLSRRHLGALALNCWTWVRWCWTCPCLQTVVERQEEPISNPNLFLMEEQRGDATDGGCYLPWGVQTQCPGEPWGWQHPHLVAAALTPGALITSPQIPSFFFCFWALLSKSAWFGKRLLLQHVTGNLFPGAVIWRKAEQRTSSHSRTRTQKVKYSCFRWQYKGVIYEKDWHRPKGLVGNMIITIKKTDYSPVANIQTFLQSVQTYKTLLL